MPPRHLDVSADFDELTDLPTMMYFRRYANAYARTGRMLGRKMQLVYFNVENFSVFNERYGFEEGDKLLCLTAIAIQAAFPGYLLSRFSADHFLLVCESRNLERGILDVNDQLHAYGRHANIALKAGIYALEDKNVDIGVACDRAKIACDSIAHRYDLTYRWYDKMLSWSVERSQYIESHIDRAIEGRWIRPYLQPIVRSLNGMVVEFEALARWEDPKYGMLPPNTFIDVLERSRLIHKLDQHMIREVCALWQWMSRTDWTMAVPMSVNLSRFDFELCDAFEMVDSIVREYDIPRQMLHVEVTESALNDNTELLSREIERFRSAGYQVWLDDFGSGFSSLNTLKDYVFDVVKIDMAFLREFEEKPKSRTIIASIVNMAKQLGMQTLIEGVETPEQFDFLHSIGCEFVQGYLIGRPMLPEDVSKRVKTGELVMGRNALHGYYDRLGAINYLSATPFEFPWEGDTKDRSLEEMLPLALAEFEHDEIRFISTNNAFERVVREIGMKSVGEMTNLINGGEGEKGQLIREAIASALTSGRIEFIDLLKNGYHCLLRIRHVASHGDVNAVLISLINFSRFTEMGEDKRLQISLRYLYAVYDEVNIVDLSQGTISSIYRGSTMFPSIVGEVGIEDAFKHFAQRFIHPDDRERYLEFMTLTNVGERVIETGKQYLADGFRAMGRDGLYLWITNVLVPINIDGVQTVLVCTRQANKEVISSMRREEKIPKSLLWDTLLDLVPAGVFWKDKDRRFVGVNKSFLDFYAFSSANDVLGKNDEEMGWHVDTDPFKNNELRVINQGQAILNARGTCIAQGEVRNIIASKIPLRQNGEVIGLLGYFTDRTGEGSDQGSLMYNGFDRMAETDHLTGILNARGLASMAAMYEQAYANGGPDFLFSIADIRGMRDFNDLYGHVFGDRILKVVGRRLTRTCGADGVVARAGGDQFVLLRQLDTMSDIKRDSMRLRDVVEGVTEVDGIAIDLHCYVGWARYSEFEDINMALAKAQERMKRVQD